MDHKLTLEQSLERTHLMKKAAALRLRTRVRRTGRLDGVKKGLNPKREARRDARVRDYELMMGNALGKAYKAPAGSFHRPGSFN